MRNPISPIRPAPAEPPPAGPQPTAQPQRTLLFVLSATMLIDALEVSIVVVALPSITSSLRIPMPAAQWLMSGFALGFGGMLLFGGRVVDRLGQRRVYLVALLAYAAMCIVSGLAPDAGVLISSRVARGFCAALTAPTGLAIIARTFPEGTARNRALAIYAAFGASGFTAGLLLSGLLTQLDWRWTLMFPAPVALVLVAVGRRVIPRAQPRPARRYDVGGAVTLAGAAALLRLRLLAHGTLTRAGLAAAALNGSYWGLLFIATFRLQDGLGWQPLPTALAFLPASVPPMLAAPFAGSLVRWLGARRLVVAGLLAATAGYAVALARPPVAYAGELLPVLLLVGLGYVGAFSGLHMHALSGVPADAARTATGVYQSLVQIGGALVLAVVAALNAAYPGYRPAFAVLTAVSALGVAAVLVSHPGRSHRQGEGMRSNDRGSRREVRTPMRPQPPTKGGPMNSAGQATDRPAPSTFAAGVAIAIIVTCQLMVVLDSTVVNIALPQMREALHFSQAGLSWVINAYTLTFGGLMLLGGRAGDIFGRRRLLVLGLIVFSVASLVGGLSVSPAMLVTARAVQGVGAAMAAPSTLALIAATFGEGPARNRALSIFSGVSAGAGSLGLILGGVLVSGASWRWVLFINVPIGLVVVLLAPRFVPEPPGHEGRLDLAGGLLSTAGLALLIYGFIWIAEGGSNAAIMAGLFAAAAVLLALFVTVEARRSSPVMPLGLVLDRTRGPVYLALLSISAAVFAMLFFISQFAQNDLHYSALRTGLAFLPLTIAIFVFSRIMPSVLARTGPRIPLLCGPALMAASMAWLSQVSPSQGYLDGLLGPFLLFGIGAGVSYVPMSATILSRVDRSETGAASGLYQAMQQIGGSVGLAVLVTVAASHGRPAALEGAAGFAALAVVLAAVATIRRAGPSASVPQPRSPEPVGRREH